jgi:peptidoglycan biosynthesis protein MviN/MurJ (putative lipid II flippase)
MEIIGWLATVFVIISFLQKDIFKLRLFSLVGALLWSLYGFILSSWSIVFLNVVITIIQVFWVFKLIKKNKKKSDAK